MKSTGVVISAGSISGSTLVTEVPKGQRLVIDTVSVQVAVPTEQRPTYAQIVVSGKAFYIPLSFSAADSGSDFFVGTERVQLYADANTAVFAEWRRTSTSTQASALFNVSGHFVKL